MFVRRRDTEEAVDRGLGVVLGMERGELLSHERAAELFGVDYRSQRYYQLIGKLKRRFLEERGVRLISIPLVGYELPKAKGQLNFARGRIVQAARRIRDGRKTTDLLPEADCSFVELRAKQAMSELLAGREREMRQESQRAAFLLRPRDSMPLRLREEDGMAEPVPASN